MKGAFHPFIMILKQSGTVLEDKLQACREFVENF
ncbi:hypothetical protein BBC0178_001420 [Bartonella apihabitans]|uniref:Uncharacterized protein n=1 Tax=Bartonella apihabitans TaxID=2750929 RepID=A0A1U9M855_9HYPH|nr:hypothetical protein BBC0178_001420 [Bartonella apihabitans]